MTWEPADALRRIAFLLERSRAGTYRVKAFRGAAATAAATDPEELRARARAGTLSDLPGIGSATEAVIREALAGQTPDLPGLPGGQGRRHPSSRAGTRSGRRCVATCTATPTGPTGGRRSRRWC